ncbi:DUF3558 family protein [Nocardia higoensis]|uniref:DUF3558 family protein n=1 Tax=Nocardia higoensis TaxID=228599 RepID=UPI0002F10756|nr:DUF3558 family protein [Nocardia higoensis]
MNKIRTLVAAAALASTVAACGTDSSEPVIDPAIVRADPCAVPDTELTSAGLTSPPYQSGTVGVEFSDWKGCIWRVAGGAVDFAVYVGAESTDAMLTQDRYRDYSATGSTTVAGSEATTIADALDPDTAERCYAAVDLESQVVLMWTRIVPGGPGSDAAPCDELQRIAEPLLPLFTG